MGKAFGFLVALVVAAAAAFGGYAVGRDRAEPVAGNPAPSVTQVPPSPTVPATPSATPSPTASPGPDEECVAAAQTQLALNECAALAAADAEAQLGEVLADVRRGTSGAQRTALDKSQREWLTYRKTFCDAFLVASGSIGLMNFSTCRADLAVQRARALCTFASPNVEAEPPSCRGLTDD
jgi:uncharacterized protein YecT (DUF1311 family)